MPEIRGIGSGTISYDLGRLSDMTFTIPQEQQYKYINTWNYNPETFYFNKVDDEEDLFLGVELEIDSGGKNDDNAKFVVNFLGDTNVYCKHDGSIANGFEIVTHPCTYEYHQQLPYKTLFKHLVNLKYRSHDVNTCGLHIHINRNYFAKDKLTQDLNISKLLYIFEKYWDKIVLIARRDSNGYAQRFFLKEDETILDMYAKSKNSNKYGVINLKHKDTVEIRIFKGTLNYDTYIATLQFVNKIVKITKSIDIYNIQTLTWEDISSTFDDNLNNYIKEREEIVKKEREEKDRYDAELVSRVSYGIRSNPNYFVANDCRGSFTLNLNSSACEELRNYMDVSSRNQNFQNHQNRPEHYNRSQLNSININDTTIEQVKQKIKFIKEDLRRSNNMERQMLQRELQKYTNRLGVLRRRN